MATVSTQGFEQADALLAKLPLEVRGNKLKSALRKAGNAVASRAKTLVPPPGYPGDDPVLKALRDTIGVEVKSYDKAMVAVVGPKYPAGAHGHLVEGATVDGQNVEVRHHSHGQPTGVILKKQPFVGPAAAATKAEQESAIIAALKKAAGE